MQKSLLINVGYFRPPRAAYHLDHRLRADFFALKMVCWMLNFLKLTQLFPWQTQFDP